jgi:hypothetical protein
VNFAKPLSAYNEAEILRDFTPTAVIDFDCANLFKRSSCSLDYSAFNFLTGLGLRSPLSSSIFMHILGVVTLFSMECSLADLISSFFLSIVAAF